LKVARSKLALPLNLASPKLALCSSSSPSPLCRARKSVWRRSVLIVVLRGVQRSPGAEISDDLLELARC